MFVTPYDPFVAGDHVTVKGYDPRCVGTVECVERIVGSTKFTVILRRPINETRVYASTDLTLVADTRKRGARTTAPHFVL